MGHATYKLSRGKNVIVDIVVGSADQTIFVQLPAILDTGATNCLIPRQVLVDLGYDLLKAEKHTVATGGGNKPASTIPVSSLTAIGETVKNIEVSCFEPYTDMPDYLNQLSILGMNFLSEFESFKISFSNQIVEIT